MDELSKCPNCAETDKVTIAGKVFCAKCGTADPANGQADANTSAQSATTPSSPDQAMPASVQKFQTTPPVQEPASQPMSLAPEQPAAQTVSPAPELQTPPPVAPVTDQTSMPQPAAQPASGGLEPVAPISPQNLQKDGLDPSVLASTDTISVSAPVATPEANPSPVAPTAPAPEAANVPLQATMTPPVNQPPTAVDSPGTPAPPTSPLSAILATPPPTSNEPLASSSPTMPPAQSTAPNNPVSDITAPTSRVSELANSEPMSLDKKDNTVFSDQEFHELAQQITSGPKADTVMQDNAVATPAPPPAEQPQTVAAAAPQPHTMQSDQSNLRASAPASTADIKPIAKPVAPPQPAPTTPAQTSAPAVKSLDQVVENSKPTKVDKKIHTKSKKGVKPASIALAIVALFLVGAYIWQVNYPNLAFKIASAKAGINASLPGYVPNGWKMAGEIQTNPGTVSYNLTNKDDSKKAVITQTKTDWDSQALAENYISPKAENYLALQAQGLTIYVYGNGQAAWVNKGNWYRIESGDQSLTQDQIIKMATSL